MNIGIVMFYDRAIESYGKLNYQINKHYCEKHNFKLILSTDKKLQHRHSAWERIPLLLENISNYDYLMWIDADAFFYEDAKNIVEIINSHPDVNFIFSNDIGDKHINSGVFIVKHTEYSIAFLKRWLYDEELYKKNPHPGWWDQGVLIDMYNKNILDIRENCVHLNYGILQHFYDNDKVENVSLIYHLAGRSAAKRCEASKQYLRILKIDGFDLLPETQTTCVPTYTYKFGHKRL